MTELYSFFLIIFLFIGAVSFLYSLIIKNIISRLNPDQKPKSRFGLVKVEKDGLGSRPRPGGIDFVFIHGLGSNPDTTWTAKAPGSSEDDVCWVTDFLPEDIPLQKRDNARLYFYNHDSFWERDSPQVKLVDLGEDLLQDLRSIRRSRDERGRYLVFVGHCYGGLIVKQALVHANQDKNYTDILTHTKAVVFLGTPHKGSSFSFWGRMKAYFLSPIGSNPSILAELENGSPDLHILHKFFTMAAKNVKSIVNFYERRKTCLFKFGWFQWSAFCVQEQSATCLGMKDQVEDIELDVDHYGLNKFGSKNGNYALVCKAVLSHDIPVITRPEQCITSMSIKPSAIYTERASLSREIKTKLQKSSPSRSRPYAVALCGLGGSGKTQLALNYTKKHEDRFSHILWIDVETKETARVDFIRCAFSLGIPVDHSLEQRLPIEDSIVVQSVRQWLRNRRESDGEWLMVFDNVDNTTWNVFDVIPDGQQGNIILISQNEQSSKLLKDCEKVSVDTMSRVEARTLLSSYMELDSHPQQRELEGLCDKVTESLGYLPLAIDLAGVFMASGDPRSSLNFYLSYQSRLLQNSLNTAPSSYDKTVWTVWDAALQKVEKKYSGRESKRLLIFLAHFTGGTVYKEFFKLASFGLASVQSNNSIDADIPKWLKSLLATNGKEWDDFGYRQACEPLINYGLIKPVDDKQSGVQMHTLVQWRALQYKKEDNPEQWDKWYTQLRRLAYNGG